MATLPVPYDVCLGTTCDLCQSTHSGEQLFAEVDYWGECDFWACLFCVVNRQREHLIVDAEIFDDFMAKSEQQPEVAEE